MGDVMIRRRRRSRIAGAIVLVIASATVRAQRGAAPPESPDRWLTGAVDIHVHSSPDTVERSVDAVEAAMMARVHHMRAIVLKNHYDSTAPFVTLVRKLVPGIEVYGGIDLNLPAGGMNAAAVEHMTQILGGAGRFVWMSTYDAENQVRFSKENRPFVALSKDGALLQTTKDVIAVIAKHGLVLATGHVSAAEGLMLVREARRQGVQHMVITHAMNPPIEMTIPQMQEAAREGAYLEFVYNALIGPNKEFEIAEYAKAIRAVGPEHVILSSDLGQAANPRHVEGLIAYFAALRKAGISQSEIDRMAKINPARALGLQ